MFLRQVVLRDGLPFEVRVPNKESQRAMEELEAGGGTAHSGGTKTSSGSRGAAQGGLRPSHRIEYLRVQHGHRTVPGLTRGRTINACFRLI
jgi:hypothetical protein